MARAPKVITKEDVDAAVAKAVAKGEAATAKAVAAETRRCVAAVKDMELPNGLSSVAAKKAVIAALKSAI